MCTQKSFKNDTERRKNMSAIDIIEYQARVPLDEQQRIAEYLNQKTPQIDVRNEVIPNYEVDSSDDEVEDDVDEESSDENIDEE